MKRKSLLFLLLMALFAPWAANAQQFYAGETGMSREAYEVQIGEGTSTTGYFPFYTLYNYSIAECLFLASELEEAGVLPGEVTSLSWYATNETGNAQQGISFWMANVSDEALTTTSHVTTDMTLVYTGSMTPAIGWNEFEFNEGTFTWDGTSNVLIFCQRNNGDWNSTINWQATTDLTFNAMAYRYQDSGAYNVTVTNTMYTSTNRPNIIIKGVSGGDTPPSCPSPTLSTTVNTTSDAAYFTWTPGGSESHWRLEYSTSNSFSSFLYKDFNAPFGSITDLLPGTTYYARVRALCGDGDVSNPSNRVSFTTECGAITNFPWSENFENYAAGDFVANCWVNEHISGDGANLFKVYTSAMGGNSTHMLQLPDMAIGTLTKLVLPEMTLPANYEFSIDIYRSSNTYQSNPYELEGIRVYASTDGNIEGATELAFIPRHYAVSNAVIPAESATGWYTYELPIGMSGTCYIILRGESQYCTATYMDNLTVKPVPTCLKPTGLAVTANSVTAHNATITWTENGEANTWVVEFATDEDFTVVLFETVEDTPTYTFHGLAPETTYYVRVKAHCGPGDESEYSNVVNFTTTIACPAPTNLTANPGNYTAALNWKGTSNSYIVSYRTAAYADGIVEEFNASGVPSGWTRYSGLVDDVIAGEDTLTSVNASWNTTSYALGQYNMKLNIYGSTIKHWLVTPEFNLSQNLSFDLALTDYNNEDPIEDPTAQADDRFIVLIYADDAWIILREWNNSGSEYVYNDISATGENVTIDLSAYYGQDVKIAFYGESTSSTGNNAGDNDLHIDNVICGIPYPAGAWQTFTVSDTTATIPGLTPLTAYEAKVQGDCGDDGTSLETNIISFTTLEACPVPQNVEVDDITYNSATVAWDGYNDSYLVSYRTAAYVDGVIEHFDVSGLPSGWTRYSGLVDDVIAGEDTLSSVSGYWNTTSHALGQYNIKLNIYGNTIHHWLVTPEFNLSQNLSFDLALTDYNNSDPIENDTLQADDRFIVLIYADDAWHILREWNNSGSQYVYNAISATGENVTIDLSAYYGKKVKIAFYGESTNPSEMTNTGGDNDLHIDNIVCGVPVEAGEWQTIEADESPVILTGLTPEMDYEVKVQGFCDGEPTEESAVVTFTTPEQTTLTQTIALASGDNWVSFYVETNMDDLKAALVEALGTSRIVISSLNSGQATWNGRLWVGQLRALDLSQMYKINVASSCEITLEAMPIDPATLTINIVNGINWIGFPFSESMTVANAFSGFAYRNDVVKSQSNGQATWNSRIWTGQLKNLEPGKGYIYISADPDTPKPFTYPTSSK